MKILYVGRSCQIGGIPNVRLRAAKGLIAQGHEVHLLSQGGALARDFKKAGVRFHLTGPTPINRFHLARLLKRGRFDLVHADNPAAGDDAVAALRASGLSQAERPALIVAVHGLFDSRVTRVPSLTSSDRVLVYDQSTVQRLRSLEGMENHPIDMARRPVAARPTPTHQATPPHFVFVSRLSKSKTVAARASIEAVEELVEAWWPQARLTIVGDGSQRKELQKLADALNTRQNREVVRLVGALKDPFPVMSAATAVIGTAMVAMEALFHGIPIVAAGYQGYGLITPDNLAAAVECNFGDAVLDPSPVTKALVWEGLHHILTQGGTAREEAALLEVSQRVREMHGIESVSHELERIYNATIEARRYALRKPVLDSLSPLQSEMQLLL